ncbi:hypothetical protein HY633_03780 [Candidatus Uhrbacteria bacterium]|nr:hypothetical protein [Candidatus Uhrbacteria bacterium]
MFGSIGRLFKMEAKLPTGSFSGKDVYSYLMRLDRDDRRRLEDEIENRGLSFGELAVRSAFGIDVTFTTPYRKTDQISFDEIRAMIGALVEEFRIPGVILDPATKSHGEAHLILTEAAPKTLQGSWQSGWSSSNGSFQRHRFLSAARLSGHALTISVFSPEAAEVALQLAKRLGLATAPAAYANESDVPISRIVDHAYHWRDRATGKHYVEFKFDPLLLKSGVYYGGGWNKDFEDGGKRIVVLASADQPQRLKLNNVFVETTDTVWPTTFMEQTRAYIRGRVTHTCHVDGCGKPVTKEVEVTRGEMSDGFGTSSFGSLFMVCDDPAHVEKIKSASPGARVTVRPAANEIW